MDLLTALFIGFLSLASLNAGLSNGGCIERERQALLKLKQDLVDPAGRLASWVADDEDCCRWKGVVCDNMTSHVLELNLRTPTLHFDIGIDIPVGQLEAYRRSKLGGKISPSLLHLKHLSYLDLSNNDFGGKNIPKFFGSLGSLRLLNLSNSGYSGEVPPQLGNLSNLKYLEINSRYIELNEIYYRVKVENFNWLSGLSSLEYLDMSSMDLSKAFNWFPAVNKVPSLVELHLPNCDLSHVQFHQVKNVNLSSLVVLDLSGNILENFTKINWVFGLKNLISLTLRRNYFEGHIPYDLQNLTFLRHLDLSSNNFSSSIPGWSYNLTRLEFLSLSYNNFRGEIPISSMGKQCTLRSVFFSSVNLSKEISHVIDFFSGCISLESLYLGGCQLSGQLTNQLGNFKNLRELILSSNTIYGSIPASISELQSLEVLFLSRNKLNGSLPESFGQLANLEFVDISDNSLKGVVSEIYFLNLTKLKSFTGNGNSLIFKVNPDWVPPFQICVLELQGWHLGPQFPQWLWSQKYLRYLDISASGISDTIPSWFWELSSQWINLNLSQNQIQGQLPNIFSSSSIFTVAIDFSSNNFTGVLSRFTNVFLLDLSNNNFSGFLFHFLCREMNESMSTKFLNLGKKFLSGELPDCWTNWPELTVIILAENELRGEIPSSMGAPSNLISLHLQKNYLLGEIPLSLRDCTSLEMLDLSGNELDGSIPSWMGSNYLQNLRVLNIRANKFWGNIPNQLCSLSSLQILDFAHNNLSGRLPSCIGNMSALLSMDAHSQEFDSGIGYGAGYSVRYAISYATDDYYMKRVDYLEHVLVVIKGQLLEYSKTLHLVRIMDFSDNNLSGEIPSEVTNLRGLQSLNLSNNLLTGRIPENIGNMQMLESADFSRNKLFGSIPESIVSLTFLSHLNLSNNQLTGRIPTSTQLQSFDASSFAGNKKLCGLPLADNCSVNGNSIPTIQNRGGVKINGFFVTMPLGFIVGFWSILSPLLIRRRWRYMYYQFLEEMWWKISDSVNKCF